MESLIIQKKMKCVSVAPGCGFMFAAGNIYSAQNMRTSTGSFYVNNNQGFRMFLNGQSGNEICAYSDLIATFEEVK